MAMQSWFSSSRKWIFNLFFSNYDEEFVVSLLFSDSTLLQLIVFVSVLTA